MKHRLVGAIVLGCLAIVFIPIVLDGEGVKTPDMNTDIPSAPALPKPLEIEPERPVILADELDASVEVVDAVPIATIPMEPQLDTQGLPDAWSVRLASFSEEANAQKLVQRLLRNDYKAYSRSLDSDKGKLIGVYVGPVLTRSETSALLQNLENEFDLKGQIVKFSIQEMEQ